MPEGSASTDLEILFFTRTLDVSLWLAARAWPTAGNRWLLSSALCRLSSDIWVFVTIKRLKGIWWMPWHREAMKDVVGCEKPRGAASKL